MSDKWSDLWKKKKNIVWSPEHILIGSFFEKHLRNKNKILEAGCGTGKMSLILANRGCSTILIDTSFEALIMARNYFKRCNLMEKAYFVRADIKSPPFKDSSFDAVFNEGVIEHFDGNERQFVISELANLLKIDGLLAVVVPNKLNIPYILTKKYQEKKGIWSFGIEIPYTPKELYQRIEKEGLIILHFFGTPFLLSFQSFIIGIPLMEKFFTYIFRGSPEQTIAKYQSIDDPIRAYEDMQSSNIIKFFKQFSMFFRRIGRCIGIVAIKS